MYSNGDLTASSDGKIVSDTSDIYINDCHGDRIFKITTGNFWITLLNTNRIAVSFLLQDHNNNNLAYVAGTDIFQIMTTYTLTDFNGEVVAQAEKDITSFPWKWKVSIFKPVSPAADIRALSIIFAHASFSEGGTDSNGSHVDKTDVCNNYIFITGMVVICVLVLFLCFLVYVFWNQIKYCYHRRHEYCNYNCNSNSDIGNINQV